MRMSTQIAVRLTDSDLRSLDWIVMRCDFGSRAHAVRAAIGELTARLEREQIDRAIIEGYTRTPESDAELDEAARSAIESIAEEPWDRWW